MTVLSPDEVAGTISKMGVERGFAVLYGHVLERLVGLKALPQHPWLNKYLKYVKNVAQMQKGGSPDFLWKGRLQKRLLPPDITTEGQAASKVRKGRAPVIYKRKFGP